MKSILFLITLVLMISAPSSSAQDCVYSNPISCGPQAYCTYTEPQVSACFPKLSITPLLVGFPFHPHHTITCDQGNASPDGNSHTFLNTHFALDLRTPHDGKAGSIFAGVSGRVIAFDECRTKNDDCGAGFGNHVKILTPDGFLVQYAHLDAVYVHTGENVKAGDSIGLEGNTGGTGRDNRHLHISVHHDWREKAFQYWKYLGALPASVPFKLQHRRLGCEGSECATETLSTNLPCIRKEGFSLELRGL